MHIEIDYKGKTYISEEISEEKGSDVLNHLFGDPENSAAFRTTLVDGSVFLIMKQAVQSCVFRFCK